jgi:hypothetical protein
MYTAVVVGRFELLHLAHLGLMRSAWQYVSDLETSDPEADTGTGPRLVVVIGSAQESRTCRNPLNSTERAFLVSNVLVNEVDTPNFAVFPQIDLDDDEAWAKAVVANVGSGLGGEKTYLFSAHKDPGQEEWIKILADTGGWTMVEHPVSCGIDSTSLRASWYRGELETVIEYLPPCTLPALRHISNTAWFREVASQCR